MTTSREIQLAARPTGTPIPSDFSTVDVPLPEPGPGQVQVRNLYLTVDPYMRGRMNDVRSYAPPFALGQTMTGGAIGVVTHSADPLVPTGAHVLHDQGWRTHANLDPRRLKVLPDQPGVPLSAYLGILGMPGLTAYAGLLRTAEFRPGDVVFVSGAAGAVGSAVGQIARLKGAGRVIGSAGSPDKVRHLTNDLGFDAAFNYKEGQITTQLRAAAPDGIDVYFDNVGGDHLEAAISSMRVGGRAAICGMISQYNATEPTPAPRNLAQMIGKQLTLRGFLVTPHYDLFDTFAQEVGSWIASGQLKFDETIVEGIDQAPAAFMGLLQGQNTGKMIVKL
ncbi:NADP-dependent oxidoreductase [Deinococcus taeanensis]|uniref:NADP-dependent oxidoreductase n=1 Tax=Deinococcus taeanensis TaxID=2737050 RepID=UPI001CDD1DD9|nr:NADP-dependent oxidoreductase [Deinococcus taeanensis]UBV41874.1 NADP-dependent oxidoreductase [Deinococcus taeanensis]